MKSISPSEAVKTAMQLLESGEDTTGVCIGCGETCDCVEPDAERYTCDACGQNKVYGAEQVIVCFGGAL